MRLQKNKVFLTVIFFACGIGAGCFCDSPAYAAGSDENLVYNFKDAKKEGTVTFTKKWKDRKLNDDRPVPDIEVSTAKPRKDVRGYTVTFHSNGLKFADGSTENEMIFNSSNNIVSGQYKMPKGSYVLWYTEPECVSQVKVSSNGIPSVKIDKDIDLYAKPVTFVLKQGPDVNKLIPDDVTSVLFTNEEMPDGTAAIDMDADGDGGVVGWVDNQCLKISTQVDGIKIAFNTSAKSMFSLKKNLTNIQFNNIDTANTTSMAYMFQGCKNLTNMDLSMFVTKQVKAMSGMFADCNSFTFIDLSSFDTSNVKYMSSMFHNCINVTEINVSSFKKNAKYKYKKGDTEIAFASDKDGAADVTFTLADNESVVFEDIPENTKYQVTEDANKYYASYEIADAVKTVQQKNANEQADQSLSTGTETVDADENAAVTFTNTGKEPDVPKTEKLKIRIKKIWNDNEDAENTRPGNITVYLMQDENIIKNIELNADNGWEAEVDGLEVLKEDGKTEYKYSVNEENVSGYDSNVVESEETDAAGDEGKVKVFTITNTKTKTGSLKVSKTVEGNGADRNKAFKFKVELKNGGNPVSGVYPLDGTAGSKTGTIVFDENGMASFELSDGESIVISGLPVGADYTVTENAYKDYKPSDNGKYNGKIETGKTGEISVVNTYDEKYDISVSKTVKGNQGDKSKNFEFVLKLTGSDGLVVPGSVDVEKNGNFETMKVVDGEVKFTLSHGEKIIFKKLPAGVKYEVTETVTDGYKMTCDNNSGVLRTNANIGFVNTKNVGIPTAAMTNTGIITAIAVCCGGVVIVAIVRAVKKKKK